MAVTPTGNIASTDVQSALAELDTEKADAAATTAALAAKAPLASPALTGTPTAPTAAQGTNTTQVATTAFTRAEIAALVNSAPGTLDTLGEIATQLVSDESTAAALATTVGTKAPLASPVFTGTPTAPTPAAADNSTKLATTAYVDNGDGLLIPKSLVDAKGDLLVGTADNTVGRLGVGSDGQVLTADTASAGGVKWAAAGGAPAGTRGQAITYDASNNPVAVTPPWGGGDYFRSGYYMSTDLYYGAGASLTVNRLYLVPLIVPVRRAFDRVGVQVTTAASAGGTLRLGIYDSSGGVPNNCLFDSGSIASTTTGAKEAVLSLTLDPGVYWGALHVSGFAFSAWCFDSGNNSRFVSTSTSPIAAMASCYQAALTAGSALPNAPTVNNITGAFPPAVTMRAA